MEQAPSGCRLYHDCFTCPFEDCIVGKTGTYGTQADWRLLRNQAIVLDYVFDNSDIVVLAWKYQVTKRLIHRALRAGLGEGYGKKKAMVRTP